MAFAAALVEILLFYLARIAAIIFSAAMIGALFAVGLPTTKGTAQISAPGIARMGQKKNAAVPTALQQAAQIRLFSEN